MVYDNRNSTIGERMLPYRCSRTSVLLDFNEPDDLTRVRY